MGLRAVGLLAVLAVVPLGDCRVLSKCDAVKELSESGISRSLIGQFLCVMRSSSQMDTGLKRGPGHKASYSYGVFQISSDRWCNAFRPGGECNKKCSDFLDDDIHDDIACAKLIADSLGFKYWPGWLKSCKLKGPPACNIIAHCNIDLPVNASVSAPPLQQPLQQPLPQPRLLHQPAPLLGLALGQL